jgi:hypothetical protein
MFSYLILNLCFIHSYISPICMRNAFVILFLYYRLLFFYIFQNKWCSTMQASFTNAFKFLYFLSPFNFMSSYIFIFHQSIWQMHLNFKIYSSTFNKFVACYILSKNICLLYTFKKKMMLCLPSIIYFCPMFCDIHVSHNSSIIYILHQTPHFIYSSIPFSTICFLTSFTGTTLPCSI